MADVNEIKILESASAILNLLSRVGPLSLKQIQKELSLPFKEILLGIASLNDAGIIRLQLVANDAGDNVVYLWELTLRRLA